MIFVTSFPFMDMFRPVAVFPACVGVPIWFLTVQVLFDQILPHWLIINKSIMYITGRISGKSYNISRKPGFWAPHIPTFSFKELDFPWNFQFSSTCPRLRRWASQEGFAQGETIYGCYPNDHCWHITCGPENTCARYFGAMTVMIILI